MTGNDLGELDALRLFLAQAGRHRLPTAAAEIALARRIERGHESKRRMIESNLRLVVSIANEYAGLGVPLLDLIQEGTLGLQRAVEKYDWRRGCKLATYATWWIRRAVSARGGEPGADDPRPDARRRAAAAARARGPAARGRARARADCGRARRLDRTEARARRGGARRHGDVGQRARRAARAAGARAARFRAPLRLRRQALVPRRDRRAARARPASVCATSSGARCGGWSSALAA